MTKAELGERVDAAIQLIRDGDAQAGIELLCRIRRVAAPTLDLAARVPTPVTPVLPRPEGVAVLVPVGAQPKRERIVDRPSIDRYHAARGGVCELRRCRRPGSVHHIQRVSDLGDDVESNYLVLDDRHHTNKYPDGFHRLGPVAWFEKFYRELPFDAVVKLLVIHGWRWSERSPRRAEAGR